MMANLKSGFGLAILLFYGGNKGGNKGGKIGGKIGEKKGEIMECWGRAKIAA